MSEQAGQTWNDALRVGVPPMDREHFALAALIDDIERAVLGRGHAREIEDLLLRLVDETSDHFATEHDLMQATGFPGREAHIEEHDRLLGHVSELLRRHSMRQRRLTIRMARSLRAGLVLHVQGKDRVLADFLAALGSSGPQRR